MAKVKARIIDLQKSLKVARFALEKIKYGHAKPDAVSVAEEALEEMFRLERMQPLQGLVGHEPSRP